VNRITLSTSRSQTIVYRIYIVVLVGLFIGSLIIRKGQEVLFINGLHTPFLDDLFKTTTNLGDGVIFVPIIIVTLFIQFRYTIIAIISCITNGLISSLFKRVVFPDLERPRMLLDANDLYFVPGVEVHETHSFPSGHTITAFCAAVFLTLLIRNHIIGAALLIFALLVACSRIYLLQHFMMDVSAGAIIGSFTTFVIWQLINGSQKEWMNRKINIPRLPQKPQTVNR
jgi:membrane-associated phospholipid phosphatase